MRQGRMVRWMAGLFMLMMGGVMTQDAHAIAAWARKYGVDCKSCHTAGFKLSAMGQDFLRSQ